MPSKLMLHHFYFSFCLFSRVGPIARGVFLVIDCLVLYLLREHGLYIKASRIAAPFEYHNSMRLNEKYHIIHRRPSHSA